VTIHLTFPPDDVPKWVWVAVVHVLSILVLALYNRYFLDERRQYTFQQAWNDFIIIPAVMFLAPVMVATLLLSQIVQAVLWVPTRLLFPSRPTNLSRPNDWLFGLDVLAWWSFGLVTIPLYIGFLFSLDRTVSFLKLFKFWG
jgi:hypothetical protein